MAMSGGINNPAKQPLLTGEPEEKKKLKKPAQPFRSADQGLIDTSNKIESIAKETVDYWKNDGLKKVGTAFVDQLKQGPTTQHLMETFKSLPGGGLDDAARARLKTRAFYPDSKFLGAADVAGDLKNPFSPPKAGAPDITFKPQEHRRSLGTFNGREVFESGVHGLQIGAGASVGKMGAEAHKVAPTMFIKSEAAKGLVPQPGTASAIPGMQQNPAVTTPGGNMTGIMNQETAMLSAAMGQGMKPGQYQDFSKSIGMNPNTPGGDGAFRNIESQIAMLNNQNSQLMGGYGQSVEMGNMSKTKRLAMVQANNEQIKGLSDSLTGRSTLANDLVKALLTAQTGKETTAMTANAGTEQERIRAGADIVGKQIDAGATVGAQQSKDARQDQKDSARLSLDSLKVKADRYKELEKTGSLTPEQLEDYESILSKIQRIGSSFGGLATGALPGNTGQL